MADPISVSELPMERLTFPAQMFSNGVVAYATISQARHVESSYDTQYWLFKFQESRYLYWGMSHNACNPGSLDPDQLPRLIYETIVEALLQINTLLQDRDSLCAR